MKLTAREGEAEGLQTCFLELPVLQAGQRCLPKGTLSEGSFRAVADLLGT